MSKLTTFLWFNGQAEEAAKKAEALEASLKTTPKDQA